MTSNKLALVAFLLTLASRLDAAPNMAPVTGTEVIPPQAVGLVTSEGVVNKERRTDAAAATLLKIVPESEDLGGNPVDVNTTTVDDIFETSEEIVDPKQPLTPKEDLLTPKESLTPAEPLTPKQNLTPKQDLVPKQPLSPKDTTLTPAKPLTPKHKSLTPKHPVK